MSQALDMPQATAADAPVPPEIAEAAIAAENAEQMQQLQDAQLAASHTPEPAAQPVNTTVPTEAEDPFTPEDLALMEQMDRQQSQQAGTQITADVEGDKDLLDTITDGLKGLVNGPYQAVNALMDKSYSLSNMAVQTAKAVGEGFSAAWDKGLAAGLDTFRENWDNADFTEQKAPLRFYEYHPETLVGNVAKGISQWAAGFLTTGMVGKAAGLGMSALSRGAVTDAAFFDTQDQRLSNFIDQFPALRNPVTEFLEAKPGDSMAEGMLKNAVEGAGLGVITDTFIAGCKMLRRGLQARAAGKEYTAEVLDGVRKDAGELQAALAKQEGGAKPGESLPPAENAPAVATDVKASGKVGAKGNLGVDRLVEAKEVLKVVTQASKEENPLRGVHSGINLNHEIFDKAGGSHTLYQLSEMQAKNTLKAAGPERRQALIANAVNDARKMGFTYDINITEGKEALKNIQEAEKTVLKIRAVMHNLSDAALHYAQKLNNGTASALDAVRFVMLSKNMQEFVTLNADLRTVTGRLLGSRNAEMTGDIAKQMSKTGDADAFMGKWLSAENMTEQDALDYLVKAGLDRNMINDVARRTLASEGDLSTVAKQIQSLKPEFSAKNAVVEYWINSLLSGPTTHLVNSIGTGVNVGIMKPLERMIGAAVTLDTQQMKAAWNLLKGYSLGMKEAWKAGRKALMLGDNILDPSAGGRLEYATHQLSYERIRNSLLKNKPEGIELSPMQESFARAVGWLGNVFRIPTRCLVAEDEFCKQVAFRGQLYADLAGEGAERGLKGMKLKEFIDSRLSQAFDAEGRIVKNELTDKALRFAQDCSWTSPLEQGSVGHGLQQMANNHTLMKLVVPFIKTPMNIFYDAMRHFPTAPLTQKFRQQIRAGGEARADALGRLAVGSMLVTSSIGLAAEGRITGAYPANPKLRELWDANGIKPYSIKIGDTWYEYRRFDPLGLVMSVAADSYFNAVEEHYDKAGQLDDSPMAQRVLLGVLTSVANNLEDKTYVQGIADLIHALDEPERRMERYVSKQVASFLPYSGALRWYKNQWGDPTMRETKGILDYVKNASSLTSKDLPPKMSWLTGEPVAYRGMKVQQKDDKVLQELLRLGPAVLGAPAKDIEGVPLNTEQYSRLCELHGTFVINGRNMKDVLDQLIHSPGYDLERNLRDDGIPGQTTPRTQAVNKVISAYRQAAQYQLLQEYPELVEQLKRVRITKQGSKAGAVTKENQQNMLNNLLQYR